MDGSIVNAFLDRIGMGKKPKQKLISPIPEKDVLNTSGKLAYVAQDAQHEQAAQMADGSSPIDGKKLEYPDWMANAPSSEGAVVDKPVSQDELKAIFQRAVQGTAHAEEPSVLSDSTDFEKSAVPIFKKYGIPASVGLGMASAEGGTIGHNNIYNINATDSNPQNATDYPTVEANIEAFAHMIATDPRYAKAYAARNDPAKMLQEIEKAGYAGDPKTWKKRSTQQGRASGGHGAGEYYDNYSQFVMDTPSYRKYSAQP